MLPYCTGYDARSLVQEAWLGPRLGEPAAASCEHRDMGMMQILWWYMSLSNWPFLCPLCASCLNMALGPDGPLSIQYNLGGSCKKMGLHTSVPRAALLSFCTRATQAGWAAEKYRKLTDPRVYHRHGSFPP